jgi:CHAT domain-containing protein
VPTGNFSFLPLHAAGVYSGNAQEYSAQYLVSSYVPTISALLKAQQDWKPIPTPALRSLLYGVSAGMRGLGQLEHASNEVAVVRKRMLEASVLVVNDASCSPTVSAVRAGLETADAHVLHLACHGLQHADPLSSCFVLEDGMLTVGDLMKLNLPHATLAFLSACQTAKGDSAQPDQAVHLAASMLFCGFRSVIGTMW